MSRWQGRLPVLAVVLGLLGGGTAWADAGSATPVDRLPVVYPEPRVDGEGPAQVASYQEDQEQALSPFQDEPALPPLPDEPAELPPDEAVELPGEAYVPWPEPAGPDVGIAEASDGCQLYDPSCYPECGSCYAAPCYGDPGGGRGPWMRLGGWIDQGVTVNGDYPADRFNGPVTFNDRDGEYQLNQLWAYAERTVNTGGYGWDVGGRVDFVYGTDWRFTQAFGLEDDWNSHRFYGAALPQCYMEVGVNNLTVRMGHYFTLIGYEVVPAPQNFFYSHSYTMQYGEPFTHTGLLATHAVGDHLKVSGGFDRGWNMWEDNNNELEFLGGIEGSSLDDRTSLAFAITSGRYDDAGQNTRNMYSIVLQQQISPRFRYVLQHDYGVDYGGTVQMGQGGQRAAAQWYGINQYFFYDLNPHLGLGLRFEWFRDDDGTRVGGIGAPHGWTLGPDIDNNQIGWAGNFYEITFGVNWRPSRNLVVRPEWRWDWYDGPVDNAGRLPYDFGSEGHQFTFATDLIYSF